MARGWNTCPAGVQCTVLLAARGVYLLGFRSILPAGRQASLSCRSVGITRRRRPPERNRTRSSPSLIASARLDVAAATGKRLEGEGTLRNQMPRDIGTPRLENLYWPVWLAVCWLRLGPTKPCCPNTCGNYRTETRWRKTSRGHPECYRCRVCIEYERAIGKYVKRLAFLLETGWELRWIYKGFRFSEPQFQRYRVL